MLQFTKRVGSMFAIVDDDDGAIDWIPVEELCKYVDDGVEINGVVAANQADAEVTPADIDCYPQVVVLPSRLCNWAKGDNIFAVATSFTVDKKGKFVLRAAGKPYKGGLRIASEAHLCFNNGVQVRIPMSDAEVLMSGSCKDPVEVIKRLAPAEKK